MVIGLGRFGISLARELTANGVEVIGVDVDPKAVREHAAFLTDAVVADGSDPDALQQLGVAEIERVVLAIGGHLEASILTASNLVEAGVQNIWAKADSEAHGRILSKLGVHHVVHPERDTGRRVAHLLRGGFREFADFDPAFGVTSMAPPARLTGLPVDPAEVWRDHGVQLIAVRTSDGTFRPVQAGEVWSEADTIIAGGNPQSLESFTR